MSATTPEWALLQMVNPTAPELVAMEWQQGFPKPELRWNARTVDLLEAAE